MADYIEFDYTDPDWKEDPNYKWCWTVCSYSHPEILEYLLNPNEILSNQKSIKIVFDYPLSYPVELEFSSESGHFTRKDFVRVVYEGYKHIYDTERSNPNRPFGIWGHSITDLFLEAAEEVEPGVFKLGIGS